MMIAGFVDFSVQCLSSLKSILEDLVDTSTAENPALWRDA